MGLIRGRKLWALGVEADRPLLGEQDSRNLLAEDLIGIWKDRGMKRATVFASTLSPGEILFIPPGAPHQVENQGHLATIAVAMNLIRDIEEGAGGAGFAKRVREARRVSPSLRDRMLYAALDEAVKEMKRRDQATGHDGTRVHWSMDGSKALKEDWDFQRFKER